ncbi:MAG: hypothetical protein RMI34_07555 [Chloroherpetonaceae bacterium]|nr:hypothetical protein [Chloroherpetonaceae bacterium]MCS7211348.1 hypothetical protein [Chloroherpetonaceae bacterium]MDW8019915.1 hypothetical protein [Chloroherpetonaceae bacterium]MDW8466601.1 hypothetical protein [Chloroherpetonaceae bacterium]
MSSVAGLLVILSSCDGKPPKFLAQKIEVVATEQRQTRPEQTGFGLINPKWASDSLWNHAVELAEYVVEQEVNGETRTFTETRLTAQVFLSKEFHTISDDTLRSDRYPVLVQQTMWRYSKEPLPTQASVWIAVLKSEPFKVARYIASWQDEKGIANKALQRLVGKLKLTCQNSFATNGEGEYELQHDTFFEDQISLSLRSLNFREGLEFVRPTLVSQLSRGAAAPQYFQGDYKVETLDTLQTECGTIACWKVSVERDAKQKDWYWFEMAHPHILVKAEYANGGTLLLKAREYKRPPV